MKFSGNSDGVTSRTLRIPQIVIAGVLILMCAMGYYLVSYSSENRSLVDKYTDTEKQLKKTTLIYTKTDRELKLCKASESSFEQSNRDLQHNIAEKEEEIAVVTEKKDQLELKYKDAKRFYVNIKDILGKGDDETYADFADGRVTQSTYSALIKILQEWKDDRSANSKLREKLAVASQKVQEIEDELKKSKTDRIQFREENRHLNGQILEMEEELDRLKTENKARGLKSKLYQATSNVKMENLNKPLETADRRIVVDHGSDLPKVIVQQTPKDSKDNMTNTPPSTDHPTLEVEKEKKANHINEEKEEISHPTIVVKKEKKFIADDENEEEETNYTHATDKQEPSEDEDEDDLTTDPANKNTGKDKDFDEPASDGDGENDTDTESPKAKPRTNDSTIDDDIGEEEDEDFA